MAEVICLCNSVFDEDLREYLDANPINSIDELREQAAICNKCMHDSQSDSPDAIAFVVHAAAAECRLPAAMGSIDRCSFELG